MKKLIAFLLILTMAVSLCGCGKSSAVKNVEAQIAAIGEVSLDSGEAIAAAQQAFDALSEKEKGMVENYPVLKDGYTTLQKLELEAEAEARFNCAQEAYQNIKSAWDTLDQWSTDLYNAWQGSIFEEKEMKDNVIPYFAENTHLTEAEVLEGFAVVGYTHLANEPDGVHWGALSEERKQGWRDAVIESLDRSYPGHQEACLMITYAYLLNGDCQIAKDALETAKGAMKTMTEQYSDYEHYPALKGFFNTANAMLDYCYSPSGSFVQYKDLLNDYRKEARNYISDLNYIFE